jgi:SAM-dependent methyltransferase
VEPAGSPAPGATRPTPHLDALVESMHGHRKKTTFFIGHLRAHAARTGRRRSDLRVLDLGCGNGRIVTLPVAEQGFAVTGVDVHEPSLAAARAHQPPTGARFVRSDALRFESPERYDAVILSDVLEHVEDPGALLAVAVRQLADDGIVLVSIPNGRGPYELEQRLLRTRLGKPLPHVARRAAVAAARARRRLRRLGPPPPEPPRPAYNEECGHVQLFSLVQFETLLRAAGLTVERRHNGAFVGGDLTYFVYLALPRLVPLALRTVDCLPARLAGSWYFACARRC